ncbi:DUF550 domain-containing protein [Salmonella enterica]|nr:DUF550 domain-containing protein [Salmonella enterica]
MTAITREQQKQILIDTANHVISRDNTSPYSENLRELARIALASLEAEPVSQPYKLPEEKGASLQLRNLIRKRHAEWSDSTFGNVGPVGPLKHLSKEALEAAAEPGDLSEWADMQFLLWDAQRRAGIRDGEITAAMEEKLKVNMARQWPEPKDGEPRLHIKEQPVSVVPDGLRQALSNAGIAAPESDEMLAATCEKYIQMLVTWVKDRKPFQPVPVVPEEITDESTEQRLMGRRWAHSFCAGWNACRAAMLSGGKS